MPNDTIPSNQKRRTKSGGEERPEQCEAGDAVRAEDKTLARARRVITIEGNALLRTAEHLDESFCQTANAILGCQGNVILSGVGKPWFIAQKISATLSSTGTPSFCLHPSDALHGDVGRVRENDLVILLSNSGSSDEIIRLIPVVKELGAKIIALTGNPESQLATNADYLLTYGKIAEACPLGLAPSTTSTTMLAMGDALALSVLEARNFSAKDYARYHPAGSLGRKLMKVRQLMRTDFPTVSAEDSVYKALQEITKSRAGAVFVTTSRSLVGIFTDGDLRRCLRERKTTILDDKVEKYMTRSPVTIGPDVLIGEAVAKMRKSQIDELPVTSSRGQLLGYLDIQDLLAVEFSVDR